MALTISKILNIDINKEYYNLADLMESFEANELDSEEKILKKLCKLHDTINLKSLICVLDSKKNISKKTSTYIFELNQINPEKYKELEKAIGKQ